MTKSSSCPSSSSSFGFNFLALLLFLTLARVAFQLFSVQWQIAWITGCLLITAGVLGIYDCHYRKVYRRCSTGLTRVGPLDTQRLVVKLIGLFGTFLIILVLYWLNPFYRQSTASITFYGYFFSFLNLVSPWIVIVSFVYFPFIDRRQKDPYDTYWHMGCLLTGRWRQIQPIFLKEHARVWFIKGFFTPIMFAILVQYLNLIFSFNWKAGFSFFSVYDHLLNIFYTLDVLYGVLGYLLTLRIIDTHVQSTEPTLLGWLVCLACYHPFYAILGIGRLHYQSGVTWEQWLVLNPVFYYACGFAIIVLSAVYGLASVAFGYRMSNLTYRGIITDGPYRFTKHPAYLAKVGSWWLISLPFFSIAGPVVALKQTLALMAISWVYYLRAKTEENHLTNYPEYVQYALWINAHGIFSPLKKVFPGLLYSPEKSRRWRSIVWFKQNI